MNVHGTHYRTIWPDPHDPGIINIIDQRLLPHRFEIKPLHSVEDAHRAIREMMVRGAGLIGATAGYGMHLAAMTADDGQIREKLAEAASLLRSARPTAVNLAWAVRRVLAAAEELPTAAAIRQAAFAAASRIADEDAQFCQAIGQHGKQLLLERWEQKGRKTLNVLTHCNAGWLAFVDYGSATAPIYAARDEGIDLHVWVDETRPWNQGARLTCWELEQEKVPHTLITDNAGGHLMQQGLVDLVIVGSDRTTHTGDVANKIGTYLKALAARDNDIPFYVALPSSTFDWNLDNGSEIQIEQRSGEEITKISGLTEDGRMETIAITAASTRARNDGFDITPARLVTALITERGVVPPRAEAIHMLFADQCSSPEHHIR
ncbi:S-methyl-5-thioribose-1-phosphate isomerase [Desulfofustis limnaeus]|jgi:methylthioribose-1-phosphate isomerase|uniref:Methylthioribose-1-phosphate isomerase n=1 Tax=Desulfofustis limnaeus TaxID=2740163 RepID=A0ABM7WBS2_9BACT|nr:S-methyl-5-thioribose-1-phosphate isomerase [Desulfofustis limnaeus]MDX9895711.1 S-methyl-5-thioribose-1-phosphate isomerase [Desulfofustis sp.]BDD88471.1 methylthioribose-1-phosphate isomerase [Desulfofustis limnaeus]